MRKIVYVVALISIFAMVACNDQQEPSAHDMNLKGLSFRIQQYSGTDLLDRDVPANILNEKIQYIIGNDTLKIAWQSPYYQIGVPQLGMVRDLAYIKKLIWCEGNSSIPADSVHLIDTDYFATRSLDYPLDFKLEIGADQFPFMLLNKDNRKILILPNGSREFVHYKHFVITITFMEDGGYLYTVSDTINEE